MLATSAPSAPLEYTLENGLRVVIIAAGAAPVATIMVLYRVGARNEAVGYTGSSHLLEHMLFKGTPRNNRANGRAFADIMNEIGASKNATTWIDRTNYFETVPIEFLPLAIELEADRMRAALIADSERRSEMTVVRNELERSDNSPARVLNFALVAAAFREHPYHHPTIGWRTDVEGVSTERLRELYDTFYHPDNATVFIVGDVDPDATRALVDAHFGALPRSAVAIPDVYTSEPPQLGERAITVKRPGDETIVAYAYHTPAAFGQQNVLSNAQLAERALATGVPNDSYALDVLSRILGRGDTSRLSRALVDEKLALDVSAWNWASRDPGLFQIIVSVKPDVSADAVRGRIDTTLAELASAGPTNEELERARTQIAVQRAFARDGTFGLAQRLGEFEAVGSWHLDDEYLERVAAVGIDDVRAAVTTYLHDDNRTLGTLLPGAPKVFPVPPFEAVEERPGAAERIEMVALPAVSRVQPHRFSERIAKATLASGVAASYVANESSATVHVRGIIDAGFARSPEHPLLPAIVAEMLSRGTRASDRITIEERLERAGVRRAYGADNERGTGYDPLAFRFTAAARSKELPLLMETLAEELREPAFAPAELERVKSELTGSLRLLKTSTGWRALQRFLELAYAPGDPNYELSVDALLADVDAIDLELVRAYHAETVLRAPVRLSAAGGVDERTFLALAERTLGDVPFDVHAPVPALPARTVAGAATRDRVTIERKTNVDMILGRTTTLVRRSADYLAALLANGILGQSTLSSRLGLRLRDREGLTYGVTSGFLSCGRTPGPWRITVGVNPANVERAVESAASVLEEYAANGPSARELVQQRNSLVGTQLVALATNAGIAQQLERLAIYELGDEYVDTFRARVEAVDVAAVRAAAQRYLAPGDLTIVAAGSESIR